MNGAVRAPNAAVGGGTQGRWPFGAELAIAAALGALQTVAFVWTAAWPLQLLCIAALAWRVVRQPPLRAAWLGLAYGTAWLGAGTWWLFVSLHIYGGLPAWLAALSVALLSASLSLYLAAAMWAFVALRSGRRPADATLFAALWLLVELARGVFFTGFPWIASGYAHIDSPLAGFAPWIGVYGVGAVTAGLATWVALQPLRRAAGWLRAGLGFVGVLGLGLVLRTVGFTEPSARLSVTLLQGNVPQDEKFAIERLPATLGWARERLLEARGDLVIAPETVIPLLPDQLDPSYWLPLLHHFQNGAQAALVGLPLGSEAAGYTNSAAGISARTAALDGGYYRYDKHHLVPFGEFVPLGFRWFTRMMNIPLGDFNRGPLAAPSFAVRSERVAPNICYEDLFGEELATRFTDAAAAPTMFANISNIAWFGRTIAIDQHLQISRMRTLEFERPMLRATNTGPTAVIDHRARVSTALAPHTQGVAEGIVEGRVGLTPFAHWAGHLGLWPAWLLAAGVVALAFRQRPRP